MITKTALINQIEDALDKFKNVMLVLQIRGKGLSAQRITTDTDLVRKFMDYGEDLKLKTDEEIYFKNWQVRGW